MDAQDPEQGGQPVLAQRPLPRALSTVSSNNPTRVMPPDLRSQQSTSSGLPHTFEGQESGWDLFRSPVARHTGTSHVAESTPLMSMGHHFKLPAEESVYSYLLFMPPIEHRRNKRFVTPLIALAVVLVLVNFVMQVGLLSVVGSHIKYKHNMWMSSLVHVKNTAWYHIIPMPYNYPPPKCRSEDEAMCMDRGNGISCAPPSIHVLTDWDLLDTDGDGVWSIAEARNEKLADQVQCDYGVDLLALYNNIAQKMNVSDALKGRRDTDLFSGAGIHKAYYHWYLHKPLLCQYGDPEMCGSLFQKGFFDEALRQQPAPEFSDTQTAVQYCTRILQHECFEILPTTYAVWRSREKHQCGERLFGHSMYQIPESAIGDDDGARHFGSHSVPMLTVDFTVQKMYEGTKGFPFRIFLGILLLTFLSVMFLELRSICKVMEWTICFPHDHEAGTKPGRIVGKRAVIIKMQENKEDSDDTDSEDAQDKITKTDSFAHFEKTEVVSKSIHSTRVEHRIVVGIMTALRLFLWMFLLWSGIMFLTGKPRYLTLIFDALSLVFIFEIDELLYRTMLRYELQEDHTKTDDMLVRHTHGGFISGRKTIMLDVISLLGLIVFAMCIVYTYTQVELNPLIDALTCLCSKDGPRCHDAQHFSRDWWDEYWSTTLPAANLIIDRLKVAL